MRLCADTEEATSQATTTRPKFNLHCHSFAVRSGILFVDVPSGRQFAYVQPILGENRWGGTSINYWGVGVAKKRQKLEAYCGKLVENVFQAIVHDLLIHSFTALDEAGHRVVMHVQMKPSSKYPLNRLRPLKASVSSW